MAAKSSGGEKQMQARAQAGKVVNRDGTEQERLFKEFLEWSKARPKR